MKDRFMDWFMRFIKLIERPRFPDRPSNKKLKEEENGIR